MDVINTFMSTYIQHLRTFQGKANTYLMVMSCVLYPSPYECEIYFYMCSGAFSEKTTSERGQLTCNPQNSTSHRVHEKRTTSLLVTN